MALKGVEYLQSPGKRKFDLAAAGVLASVLVSASVLTVPASIIGARTLRPLFRQPRVGKGGEEIDVWKLRTIPEIATQGEMTLHGTFDPRATALGRMLRASGVDEFPQLVNVFAGDMSVVGLRPMLPEALQALRDGGDTKLFDDWYEAYIAAKPGLIGPGQLYRHQFPGYDAQVLNTAMGLELEYVTEASLREDTRIFATFPWALVASNVQAFTNHQVPARD